jgi:hypothetical protein
MDDYWSAIQRLAAEVYWFIAPDRSGSVWYFSQRRDS